MDDAALLERAREGDRDAFASIATRHQDELYTMALRFLGSPDDAADVVQETFLRAYMRLPELRPETVRAWLFRVTLNCCHDVRRREVRKPAASLDGSAEALQVRDSAPSPEEEALRGERSRAIVRALATLPDEFRAAVVLRDVSELSYEEISVALQVPLGTAKSRVSRGRRQLAGVLSGSVVAPEGPV